MKSYYLFAAGLLIFSACTSNAGTSPNEENAIAEQPQNGTQNRIKTVNSAETKKLLEKQKDVVILDVRTPEEYTGGHLKNATLINKYDADFEARIKALDRDKTYLIYCAKGGRSGDAARMMQQLGFKNIYDATEGFESLKKAGAPVEK